MAKTHLDEEGKKSEGNFKKGSKKVSKKIQQPQEEKSESEIKKKRRIKKKNRLEHFESYIKKLLNKQCPDTQISGKAMSMLNQLNVIFLQKLSQESGALAALAPTTKIRLQPIHVKGACYVILPETFAEIQTSESRKAVTLYNSTFGNREK